MFSSKYIFTNETGDSKVTHEFSEIELTEVVARFEEFLKGCGFQFDGYTLDFVSKEQENKEDDQTLLLG